MNFLRNLPTDAPESLRDRIQIQPGRVVSMALSKSDHCLMTLLAFADGESVSEEQYFGDTMYYVLEGTMPLTINGKTVHIGPGQCYMVPAQQLHAVGGKEPFKLLQITVQD